MSRVKKIIFILIFIAIIVGLIIFAINKKDKKYKYNVTNISMKDVKYLTSIEGDKNGVIDLEGNTVVEAKFAKLIIPNPTQNLFIVTDDENSNNWYAIDDKGNKLLTDYEDVEAIPIDQTSSLIPYEKEVLKYRQNNLYGLIDFSGKKLTAAEYESIEALEYKEGTFVAKKNGKCGLININGATVVDFKYDEITTDGYYDSDTKYSYAGFIVRTKTDDGYRYGYINNEGKVILDTIYNDLSRINKASNNGDEIYTIAALNGRYGAFKGNKQLIENDFDSIEFNNDNKLFIVSKGEAYGVFDISGKSILPLDYSSVIIGGERISATKGTETLVFDNKGNKQNSNFTSLSKANNNTYVAIDMDGNYNIVDKNEKKLLNEDYEYIEYFTNDYFIVNKDQKSGVIKSNGESVVDLKYASVQKILSTNCLKATTDDGNTYIISTSGKVSEGVKDGDTAVYDNYIKLYSSNDFKYFDLNGNEVTYQSLFPDKKIYAKKQNGKWGFVDKSGNVIVDYKYDMVSEQNETTAGVKLDGKWGVIDTSGNLIVEPKYNIFWDNVEFVGKYYKTLENIGISTYSSNENI